VTVCIQFLAAAVCPSSYSCTCLCLVLVVSALNALSSSLAVSADPCRYMLEHMAEFTGALPMQALLQPAEARGAIVPCWCLRMCMLWSVVALHACGHLQALRVAPWSRPAQLRPSCICLGCCICGQHVPALRSACCCFLLLLCQ